MSSYNKDGCDLDAEWQDICYAILASGLVTWENWIEMGREDAAIDREEGLDERFRDGLPAAVLRLGARPSRRHRLQAVWRSVQPVGVDHPRSCGCLERLGRLRLSQVRAAAAGSDAETLVSRCDFYWGSHGCGLDRGHDGEHTCDEECGDVYDESWTCYGFDSIGHPRSVEEPEDWDAVPGRGSITFKTVGPIGKADLPPGEEP